MWDFLFQEGHVVSQTNFTITVFHIAYFNVFRFWLEWSVFGDRSKLETEPTHAIGPDSDHVTTIFRTYICAV
jgi:hypothetical protein